MALLARADRGAVGDGIGAQPKARQAGQEPKGLAPLSACDRRRSGAQWAWVDGGQWIVSGSYHRVLEAKLKD